MDLIKIILKLSYALAVILLWRMILMFTFILYIIAHMFSIFAYFQNIANILGYQNMSVRLYLLTVTFYIDNIKKVLQALQI